MNNQEFNDFLIIQKSLDAFTESDKLKIVSKMEIMDQSNYQYLSILFLSNSIAKPRLVKQYVDLICQQLQSYEPFIPTFTNYLLNLATKADQEGINTINFLINQFLQRDLIDQQYIITKLQSNIYFSHILLNKKLVVSTNRNLPYDNFLRGIDNYSSNDWEKHKLYINKGINPDQFAEIIFNDNVESLRYLIIELEKNPNSIIQPSIYDLLNFNKPISLLEYSALAASLKCFKFLLLNGAKVTKEIGYYAISGGDAEIIHICEQKGVKRKKSDDLYLSLKYHHIELFKWLLDQEPTENEYHFIMMFSNYEAISFINESEYAFHYFSLCKAVEFNQFIIFKAIIERGVTEYFSNNESVMNSVCSSKNSSFFDFCFDKKDEFGLDFLHSIRKGLTPLHSACLNGNLYQLNHLLELPNIDVNIATKILFFKNF